MLESRLQRAFEEVKKSFDPTGLFNPGKIVHAPKMDDRDLFRYKPGYSVAPIETALDWSEWGGFGGAVEMCNNNGACRKANVGVMCPSYRATLDEQDLDYYYGLVSRMEQQQEISPLDIAAALTYLAQTSRPFIVEAEELATPKGKKRRQSEASESKPAAQRRRRPGAEETNYPLESYRLEVGTDHQATPREIVGAIAVTEPEAGSDVSSIKTRAVLDGTNG